MVSLETPRPMPPAPSGPRQASAHSTDVVIIADGWTRRVFNALYEAGELPEIRDAIVGDGGGTTDVVSNLPSISLASHTTLLTGASQQQHGIVGHRWRDSTEKKIHNYLGVLGARNVNGDISPQVPTLFEQYDYSVSVQSIIHRGAGVHDWVPTMRSEPILRRLATRIEQRPNGLFVGWLPAGDRIAHSFGPDSQKVADDMRASSRALGNFAHCLRRAGVWEQTRLLVIPDHGHRAVRRTVDLRASLGQVGLRSQTNRAHDEELDALTLTSGDSAANIYLADHLRSRRLDIARKLPTALGIELACVPIDDQVYFFSESGSSVADYSSAGEVAYQRLSGPDPLALDCGQSSVIDRSLARTSDKYPDLLHQIRGSFAAGRSGDLLVLAGSDAHFGLAPRRGWRLGYHRGTHGGPTEDEVLVTAVHRGFDRAPGVVRSADVLAAFGLGDHQLSRIGVDSRDLRV